MSCPFPKSIVLAGLMLFLVNPPVLAERLKASTTASQDGVVTLAWSLDPGESVRLERSPDATFHDVTTLYQGRDTASTITGLPDGRYFFRASGNGWQETVAVDVEHHSLTRAFVFFILGAVVFLSTAALVVVGSMRGNRVGR